MTPGEIDAIIGAAHRAYGASYDGGLVLLGSARLNVAGGTMAWIEGGHRVVSGDEPGA